MRELLGERPNQINPGTGTSQDELPDSVVLGRRDDDNDHGGSPDWDAGDMGCGGRGRSDSEYNDAGEGSNIEDNQASAPTNEPSEQANNGTEAR